MYECHDLQLLIHDDPSIVYFMVLAMVSQHEDALIAAEGAEDQQMTLLKSAGAIADAPAIRRHTPTLLALHALLATSF